jgi:hypothetical protein
MTRASVLDPNKLILTVRRSASKTNITGPTQSISTWRAYAHRRAQSGGWEA